MTHLRKKKLRLKRSTCAVVGVVGALATIGDGILKLLNVGGYSYLEWATRSGGAQYASTLALVFYGAMLLLLAVVVEKGPDNKRRRLGLLGLFLLLLVSYMGLPPLDVLEAPVLPLLLVMYHRRGDAPFIAAAALFEVAFAVLRLMLIAPSFAAGSQLLVAGWTAIAIGLVRGVLLLRLRGRLAAEAPPEEEGLHRLR